MAQDLAGRRSVSRTRLWFEELWVGAGQVAGGELLGCQCAIVDAELGERAAQRRVAGYVRAAEPVVGVAQVRECIVAGGGCGELAFNIQGHTVATGFKHKGNVSFYGSRKGVRGLGNDGAITGPDGLAIHIKNCPGTHYRRETAT
jgi:hypothetical protein